MPKSSWHTVNKNVGFVPDQGFSGFRDRSIPVTQLVGCPDCKVEAGVKCFNKTTGLPKRSACVIRRKRAIRFLNENPETALTKPDPVKDRVPGKFEDPEGVLCDSCGLTIKTRKNGEMYRHTTIGGQLNSARPWDTCVGNDKGIE